MHLHQSERALQAFHVEARARGINVGATQGIDGDLRKIRALIEGYLAQMSLSLRSDGSFSDANVDADEVT